MTEQAQELLAQVLRLPLSDRTRLVVDVLASMDGEPEPGVEEAWAAEASRRMRRYLAGEDEAREWSELRARLRARLDG